MEGTGGEGTHRPLSLLIASPQCVPWCPGGSQLKFADPDTPSWSGWITEASEEKHDITTMENNYNMPISAFAEKMEPHNQIIYLVFGPEVLGFPTARTRLMASGINRETMVWVGPVEPNEVREKFFSMFGTKCMLDCDSYAGIDSDAGAKQFEHLLFERHSVFPRAGGKLNAKCLLTQGQMGHLDGYSQINSVGEDNGWLASAFCCDISQQPSTRHICGPWMPSLQKTSEVISLSAVVPPRSAISGAYFYSPNEVAFSQGWPTAALNGCKPYAHCPVLSTSDASLHFHMSVNGNGVHLAALSAWQLFIMAHTIRRSQLELLAPPLFYKRPVCDVVVDLCGDSQNDGTQGQTVPPHAPVLPLPAADAYDGGEEHSLADMQL